MSLAAVEVGNSVQQALDSFVGFVPNLLGFVVILAIGWLIAYVDRLPVAVRIEGQR